MPSPLDIFEAERRYRRALGHVKLYKQLRTIETETLDYGAVAQAELQELTRKLKRLMDRLGVWCDWHPSYIAYAFALNKSQKDLPDQVDRTREWNILRDRWGRRGLDPTVLGEIDQLVRTDI